jgi:hypothetical protein
MAHFILRYTDRTPNPTADVERIRQITGVTLLDDTSPHMLLIDATDRAALEQVLQRDLSHWSLTPETMISLPDTRKRIRHPADPEEGRQL